MRPAAWEGDETDPATTNGDAGPVCGGPAHASCGSAFCLVNTNWGVQGVWNEPGLRADLRFEYIDQDQPRNGTHDVAVGEIPRHRDEVRTVNRNLFATFDYGISQSGEFRSSPMGRPRARAHHNHQGEQLRETGGAAEPGDSGSRTLPITPGISVVVAPGVNVYAFVQFPVYQRVNGVQLVADRSYAAGVSAQF